MMLGGRSGGIGPIQLVDSTKYGYGGSGISFSIAGLTINNGDLGVAFVCGEGRDSAYTISSNSGAYPWTELKDSPASATREGAVWYRRMNGSETTFNSASAVLGSGVSVVLAIFRNAADPVVGDYADNYANSSSPNLGPNPPQVAATVNDGDWVLCFGMADNVSDSISAVSSGYTAIEIENDANRVTSAMGYKTGVTGSSEDPAFFAGSFTGQYNIAGTLILRNG